MDVPEFKATGENGGDNVYEAKQSFASGDICLAVVEFTSTRKRASVVVRHTVNGTEMARVYTKGAPDMLFPMLSGVLDSDMGLHGLDEQTTYDGQECTEIEKLNLAVKKFASQAYRTILITKKDMTMDEFNDLKAS